MLGPSQVVAPVAGTLGTRVRHVVALYETKPAGERDVVTGLRLRAWLEHANDR
jgi:hypothetical protein